MLKTDKYNKGLAALEQTKYNINFNKCVLFDIICSNLASKLLNSEYTELNPEQEETLTKIVNK